MALEYLLGAVVSGLAVGSMYAMGTISLSMVWGSLRMVNMAHGAILSLGAYASFLAVAALGFPWWLGILPAAIVGALGGAVVYTGILRWLIAKPNFSINTIIATIGAAALTQNIINVGVGAEARLQPFSFDGAINLMGVTIRLQPIVVLVAALLMTVSISYLLTSTRTGRAIRAVSQQRDAAYLMGIPVGTVYLKVMIIAGAVSGLSGLLLTGLTTVYPSVGAEPTIKALIICTLAGVGQLWGAVGIALAFGLCEVSVQYALGTGYGFSITLALAIALLIWRPYGLFGKAVSARL